MKNDNANRPAKGIRKRKCAKIAVYESCESALVGVGKAKFRNPRIERRIEQRANRAAAGGSQRIPECQGSAVAGIGENFPAVPHPICFGIR